jgi:hypothetical protein
VKNVSEERLNLFISHNGGTHSILDRTTTDKGGEGYLVRQEQKPELEQKPETEACAVGKEGLTIGEKRE